MRPALRKSELDRLIGIDFWLVCAVGVVRSFDPDGGMKMFFATVFAFLAGGTPLAISEYCNPLEVQLADPAIMKTDHGKFRYYMSGTGCARFASNDLVSWRRIDNWTSLKEGGHRIDGVWGTEGFESQGRFYLYFAARVDGAANREICVASADSPDGHFTPLKYPIWSDGDKWIGPTVFTDDNGDKFLFATNDSKSKHDGKAIVYGAKLNLNMVELDSAPKPLIEPSQKWERAWQEGVCVTKHKDTYYMLWSSRCYVNPQYSIGYATASDPLGPYKKSRHNPLLAQLGAEPKFYGHTGPGSNGLVRSPDGNELFIVYHTHRTSLYKGRRSPNIDRVQFLPDGAGPDRMLVVNGPSRTPQPWPSGAPFAQTARSDEFDGAALRDDIWTNIWGERPADYQVNGGSLVVACGQGGVRGNDSSGSNVFLQYAAQGDWTISTQVELNAQRNAEQAFLVVWQDCNNYIMLSTAFDHGKKFVVASEVNEDCALTEIPNTIGDSAYLRISKTGDGIFTCHVSDDGKLWTQVGDSIERRMLDQKVGLGAFRGRSEREGLKARFNFFRAAI
jgi:beta-xylosidase